MRRENIQKNNKLEGIMQIKLKNEDGSINYLAFSEDANKFAKEIHIKGLKKNQPDNKEKNAMSQIRKFYDEFFKLTQRAISSSGQETKNFSEKQWKNVILPQLHMLIPKVVYAKGRKLVTDEFVNFLKQIIEFVKTKEDLKIACDFFEAFIGYYRAYRNK